MLAIGRRLTPALAEPADILEALQARLAAARLANRDATRLRAELTEQQAAWQAAQTERDEALGLLEPLVQAARVDDRPALAAAVLRLDARRGDGRGGGGPRTGCP
ncbi:MAG: hypothetical protein R3E68_14600 [Burkholderiaceae bacterium]